MGSQLGHAQAEAFVIAEEDAAALDVGDAGVHRQCFPEDEASTHETCAIVVNAIAGCCDKRRGYEDLVDYSQEAYLPSAR